MASQGHNEFLPKRTPWDTSTARLLWWSTTKSPIARFSHQCFLRVVSQDFILVCGRAAYMNWSGQFCVILDRVIMRPTVPKVAAKLLMMICYTSFMKCFYFDSTCICWCSCANGKFANIFVMSECRFVYIVYLKCCIFNKMLNVSCQCLFCIYRWELGAVSV